MVRNAPEEPNHVPENEELRDPPLELPRDLDPPSELPRDFKNAIDEMSGTRVCLVIEKFLFKSDVADNNGRLAIMFREIRNNFLTHAERRSMAKKENMNVTIIDTSWNVRRVVMRQWNMGKKNEAGERTGSVSSMYVLKTHRKVVVSENRLKENDKLQVWAFRAGRELRLALVVVQ